MTRSFGEQGFSYSCIDFFLREFPGNFCSGLDGADGILSVIVIRATKNKITTEAKTR